MKYAKKAYYSNDTCPCALPLTGCKKEVPRWSYDGRPNLEYFFEDDLILANHREISEVRRFETEYDMVQVTIESDVYPLNFEDIYCTVTNYIPGNVFYVWKAPFVDYYDGEKWIELLRTFASDLDGEGESFSWEACGLEEEDRPYSITLRLSSLHINSDLRSGLYRVVVYVGDRKVYAPFTLVEDDN